MDEILTTLQDQVWSFPLSEGTAETGVSGVTACRSTAEVFPMPESEDPYLFLVVDGSIRLYTPSGILDYGAGQYSISKIDTPLSGKAVAFSQRGDLLLRSISFTAHDVISVVLDLEEPLLEKITSGTMEEEDMAQADRGVFRAVSSLLAAREQPVWSEFLRKTVCKRSCTGLCAGPAAGSCSKVWPTLDQRRRSMRPTAGSRNTSAAPSPWRSWQRGGT